MSFLPIAIVAYALNGGAILIDKILLRTTLPNPITYTFFINLFQILVIFLIPFGFKPELTPATFWAISSGMVSVVSFYAYFASLKRNEASIVGPVVGTFNPLFALLLGGLFLGQILTLNQYLAFFVLLIGSMLLTLNLWHGRLILNKYFFWMVAAGFFFGLSYVLLRQAFLTSSFLNAFIISRVSAALFALTFLLYPVSRRQIFASRKFQENITSRSTLILLISGQTMGALSTTLLTIGTYFAHPSLVNSVFGVQYLVILAVAIILVKKHPHLLNEHLSQHAVLQKVSGAIIISLGLYLLAR
ncbi:MAG: DMT family transporter [Candidatus Daviesbacteria bacterium]